MQRRSRGNRSVALILLGTLPIIYFGLKIAPFVSGGFQNIIQHFPESIKRPFEIVLVKDSLRTIVILLLIYFLFLLTQKDLFLNLRPGEEYGSERWANKSELKVYEDKKDKFKNKILSSNVKFSIDDRFHKKNTNVLIVGGPGTGKTRYFAKPNIMQANSSYIVLDPKGELLRDTGSFLKNQGYEIKVINLLEMSKSNHYNPFAYITTDDEVQEIAENFWVNTTPKDSKSLDPFWDNNALILLKSLMFFLLEMAPPYEQNFAMIADLCLADSVEQEEELSDLDRMFAELELENPESRAISYYKSYKDNPFKTKKKIRQTLVGRLEKFYQESLRDLTNSDDINLLSVGTKKTALFCITPEYRTSYNFIIGMLYTQLFQKLYEIADRDYGGRLPIPVHIIMDEFANVVLPGNFINILATMRSKWISCSILLQNLNQLKTLYKESWESIIGNCSIFMFLGGQEKFTIEYLSSLLGKETIDTKTSSESKSDRSGSTSSNYQQTGRDLITVSEIRRLDNELEIILIQGFRPILDKKYVLEKHPNYSAIVDGGGKAYEIELLEDEEIVRTEQVIKVIEMTLDDVLAQAGFIFKESGTETEEEISEKRAKAQDDFRDELAKEIILVSSDEINNCLRAEELKQYNERLGK